MPHWLRIVPVPLFVQRRRLTKYRTLPRAINEWALDSGAFSEVKERGGYQITAMEYAREVRRYRDEIGRMLWAAPQDWPCEAEVLKSTGKTILEHQRLTVENYLELMSIAPDLPWIPVLQGWRFADYMRHAEMYLSAGVSLKDLPLVGIGSVCRRQDTLMAEELIIHLHSAGLKLHGFGFKVEGLRRVAGFLESADSMSWSYAGRFIWPCPHSKSRKNCANCLPWAMEWREEVLRSTMQPCQPNLFSALEVAQ